MLQRTDSVHSFEAAWPRTSGIPGWLAMEEAAVLHRWAARVAPGDWIVEIGSHRGRSTAALATGKSAGVPVLAIDPFESRQGGDPPATLREFCANMDAIGAGPEVRIAWATSEEVARRRRAVFECAARASSMEPAPETVDAGPSSPHPGSPDLHPRIVDVAGMRATDDPTRSAPMGDGEQVRIGLLFVDGRHDRGSVVADIDLWEPLVAEGGVVIFHDAFFRIGVTEALFQRHALNRRFRYGGSVVNTSLFQRVEAAGPREMAVDALTMTLRLAHFARNMAITLGVRRNWRWLQRRFPPLPDFEY